jgi:hypothetical protein
METPDQLWRFFRDLLQMLPSLLTLIGCIIFSLARWKRYPRVSLVTVISLLFLLVHAIVFAAIYVWLPGWFIVDRSPSDSFQTVIMILRLTYNTTLALGFGLLLAAIFMRRPAVAGALPRRGF